MEYLYHGSIVQNLKWLEPRKRYTPAGKIEFAAIYATPMPAYTACQSFPWSSEEGIDSNIVSDKITLEIPSELENRLDAPISIYKISSKDFEHTKEESTGLTWHSKKPTPIIEEVKYPSAKEALRILGVGLVIL